MTVAPRLFDNTDNISDFEHLLYYGKRAINELEENVKSEKSHEDD